MAESLAGNATDRRGVFAARRAALLERPGADGPARRRALSRLTDEWLAGLASDAGLNVGGVALVAVGGYGRSELSPFSDLDLLLLHSVETPESYAAMIAERLWYPIWDSGLRVDHAVRSVGGARQVARTDLPTMLGLLDVRHLAGDALLVESLRRKVLADWRGDARQRLPQLQESCLQRADRSGELAFATVPDLKESRGGLRDLVVLRAVAASWVTDCPHHGMEEARSDLLDIRDALHLTTGRAGDRMQVQDQDAIAAQLHLPDRDELARRVAGIGRSVALAADLTWRRVERELAGPERGALVDLGGRLVRRAERRPLADGVVEQEGEAVLARSVDPHDGALVLRVAAAAAQAGIPVAPSTLIRLARLAQPLPEPWPAEALDAFLVLLGAGEPMLTVWEGLDQAGLIAMFLPGWERLRSLPQRDPIHQYTVDRHLMQTAVNAAALVRRVSRPDLLLLAAIFHDIGKGLPGDHSQAGAESVGPWLRRMGLAEPDIAVVQTLISHHLLLSETATRRDPDDPATVAAILTKIPQAPTLDLLAALTEADAKAAGPAAWTSWRAGQIQRLVVRVRASLAGARPLEHAEPTPAELELLDVPQPAVRVDRDGNGYRVTVAAPDRRGLLAAVAGALTGQQLTIRAATARTIDGVGLQSWYVQPNFGEPAPADTVRSELLRAVSDTARSDRPQRRVPTRASGRAAGPEVSIVVGASAVATVLEVRAHDQPGLLQAVTAALAQIGVGVTSAWVHTLGADVVDVFYICGADGFALAPDRHQAVLTAVRTALE